MGAPAGYACHACADLTPRPLQPPGTLAGGGWSLAWWNSLTTTLGCASVTLWITWEGGSDGEAFLGGKQLTLFSCQQRVFSHCAVACAPFTPCHSSKSRPLLTWSPIVHQGQP